MVLDTHPSYPSARSYVLKLHRDADLTNGRLFGRVEKVATGEQFAFANADELLAILMSEARRKVVRTGE